MNFLEKIVKAKRTELEVSKSNIPVDSLERSEYFNRETVSLEKALLDSEKHGIIAEFKRQSPSHGVINPSATSGPVCFRYFSSGASAVSVLTNSEFFGGRNEDLVNARQHCQGPILRKEFIIDEYQVIESKSIGADAILLIADILSGNELRNLSQLAYSLKMEVLFEIHDKGGIGKLPRESILIGINSRNLGNFRIDMGILKKTIGKLPKESIKIAESGINSAMSLVDLEKMGFRGFLIGELFMRENDPGDACRKFVDEIRYLKSAN